jgi:hypothetical protein
MLPIAINTAPGAPSRLSHRSVATVMQMLLRSRRQAQGIAARARRQRVTLGYGHVPERVWNRRSALLTER